MTARFANPLARGGASVVQSVRAIKCWTRKVLDLPDEAVVSVNEVACPVPGCPPRETIILVMQGSETHQASIHKAMAWVSQDDVRLAFNPAMTPQG